MSFCAIVRQLKSEGVRISQGGQWHPETTKKILGNKKLYRQLYGNVERSHRTDLVEFY
jgi:hypothetical protein